MGRGEKHTATSLIPTTNLKDDLHLEEKNIVVPAAKRFGTKALFSASCYNS